MPTPDIIVRRTGAESGTIPNGPAHYHGAALASVDRRIRLSNAGQVEENLYIENRSLFFAQHLQGILRGLGHSFQLALPLCHLFCELSRTQWSQLLGRRLEPMGRARQAFSSGPRYKPIWACA